MKGDPWIRRIRDYRAGRHSNLPRCCCAFVCFFPHAWTWNWRRAVKHETDPSLTWEERAKHGYVRCPLCVVRDRWVNQHLCDRQLCGRWFIDLGMPQGRYPTPRWRRHADR